MRLPGNNYIYGSPLFTRNGHYTKQMRADLYVCFDDVLGITIIARGKGYDYTSCPMSIIKQRLDAKRDKFSTMEPALIAGYYFAKAKGLGDNE